MNLNMAHIFPINADEFHYSKIYSDDDYEYRHVIIPKKYMKFIPKNVLFTEAGWGTIGIQMSSGWQHFMIHGPEPHIMLFRREKSDEYLNDLFFKLLIDF